MASLVGLTCLYTTGVMIQIAGIMSVFAIKSGVWGSYTEQEYSSFELKSAWYMPGFLCSY
jgi:hypothetical protein